MIPSFVLLRVMTLMTRYSFKSFCREYSQRVLAWSPTGLKARRRRNNAKLRVWKDTAQTEDLESRRLLTVTAAVTPVSHPPVGTSGTVTSVINTPYKIPTSAFGFTDPNDSPPNAFTAVKITLLPGAGSLTDNGVAVSTNQTVTVADMNAGKFAFTPNANLSGGPFFLCKFEVQDNGGTGANLDTTAKVLDISLRQANHPPLGKSATVNTPVNTVFKFKTTDFGFSDPFDHPPDSFTAVKIDILPGAGKITDNGVAVTVGQEISVADIAAGKLIFTPTANLKGGPYLLCKFQVEDSGGSAGGGSNIDPKGAVLDIDLFFPA
jgi:hypothetical protein